MQICGRTAASAQPRNIADWRYALDSIYFAVPTMARMKGSEDLADYLGYIDGALRDGLLSEGEWTIKMESAPSYNLSAEQAERLVVERCVEQGAVIEHFEIQKLRDLIAIAAPDRVLEASIQVLLRRLAEERYRHTKLPSPQAHVDQLVGERLSEAKLREEKPLRQKISERLHTAAGPGRSIRREEWRRIYSGTLQELGISGGDISSDLVGLFLDCRRELGIEIAEPEPPPEPAHPAPPPKKEPLPRQPVVNEPSETPSALASLGKLVLISLVVAVLVFFFLKFLDRGMGSAADRSSIEIPIPPCDDECVKNLQTWTAELEQDPSSKVLDLAVKKCERYLNLLEAVGREAKDENSSWELCEHPVIVEEFQKRSGQTSG
jgi:hypothetical protein